MSRKTDVFWLELKGFKEDSEAGVWCVEKKLSGGKKGEKLVLEVLERYDGWTAQIKIVVPGKSIVIHETEDSQRTAALALAECTRTLPKDMTEMIKLLDPKLKAISLE